jgi:hypothetical protein
MRLKSVFSGVLVALAFFASPASAQCLPAIFPVGWLAAQSVAGGHTIARHVGRNDMQLVNRLNAQPHIAAASTYPGPVAVAQATITAGLSLITGAANGWANNAVAGQRRIDNFMLVGGVAGRVALRPPGLGNIINSSYFRTVLEADGIGGCFLLTSYPYPPPPPPPPGAPDSEEDDVDYLGDAGSFNELAGYLAGQFGDPDPADATDAEFAVGSLSLATREAYQIALEQGLRFIAAGRNPELIGDWANRDFKDGRRAFEWLAQILEVLADGLSDLQN